ncbi:hypothetical protein Srubr_18180 [Streptomyces rubradiris]|uniref:Malonyl-CoA:ACP transacylase (MAT) domain-containing protein n=1 Tax=Streptomyces rubradiris TaxID=285531 RepID=A0ABQ3R7Z8_STRRR|nr:ketoacyl-synthetase C-terminal extension domain-containing protein [Streptomyces rubradiris]GHI51972.1 hypothetical protein Srubr_18180 [Streptomyces rubradiris]
MPATRRDPADLHFSRLNSNISFDGTTFRVPTGLTPWPHTDGPRTAAVSSFGLSGTNVHMILQQAPATPAPAAPDDRRPASVLPLSARTETALAALAGRYAERLAAGDDASLADLAHSAGTGRSHFRHRSPPSAPPARRSPGSSPRSPPARRPAWSRARPAARSSSSSPARRPAPRHGPPPVRHPAHFPAAVDECAEILRPLLARPLLDVMFPDDPDDTQINDTAYAQPATFVVEYALARLWESWGITPRRRPRPQLRRVRGRLCGAVSLEDGLAFAVERARIIQEFCLPGTMAAVFASEEGRHGAGRVPGPDRRRRGQRPGERGDLRRARRRRGRVRRVRRPRREDQLHIASAGHSPLMDPVLEPLRRAARKFTFTTPRIPLVSNVTGELWPWDQRRTPTTGAGTCAHGALHRRRRTLRSMGYRTFLEVGPAPTLLG